MSYRRYFDDDHDAQLIGVVINYATAQGMLWDKQTSRKYFVHCIESSVAHIQNWSKSQRIYLSALRESRGMLFESPPDQSHEAHGLSFVLVFRGGFFCFFCFFTFCFVYSYRLLTSLRSVVLLHAQVPIPARSWSDRQIIISYLSWIQYVTLGRSGFVATESAKTKWVALLIDPDLCV